MTATAYRPDIDGIRALAVIPVVLFHAKVPGFSGGFVGVDIFFVISGFLITQLIQGEIMRGRFSYIDFWERRARRLLPPMIVVVGATVLASGFILMPVELQALGQSVIAFALFVSNIHFWLEAGYFGAAAETIPLLHTWSLAVEEQFYILFPALLLLLATGSARLRLGVIVAVGVVSFVISVWWTADYPNAAYYLLPSRAWQLMLGAALAMSRIRTTRLTDQQTDGLYLVGLALVFWPIMTYNDSTPFPGLAALAPCLGTVCLIVAGAGGTGRLRGLFAHGVPVTAGRLSYGIYLWHWPLLTLWAASTGVSVSEFSPLEVVSILGLTLLLSWLSYRWVEQPVRTKKVLVSRSGLFRAGATGLLLLAAAGLAAHLTHGFGLRLPPDIRLIAHGADDFGARCEPAGQRPAAESAAAPCVWGKITAHREPTVLLWGDSHASALYPGLALAAEQASLAGISGYRGGCPPLPNVLFSLDEYGRECIEHNAAVLRQIEKDAIRVVVMTASWSRWIGDSAMTEVDPQKRHHGPESAKTLFAREFDRVIETLLKRDITVIIVEEIPYSTRFHPSRFAAAVWHGADPASAGLAEADYQQRNRWFTDHLDELEASMLARYPVARAGDHARLLRVTPASALCDASGHCASIVDGHAVYRDESHLSGFGARLLAPQLTLALTEASR